MWTLLDLAGSVALLLWGLHMVQTGIQRGFGPDLRRWLGTTLGNRLAAFAAGLGVTAILQSSTATGLMLAGFAAGGAVALVPALAVMLGANVGTTLIVQLLSFDVAQIAPALILLGVILFRRGTATRTRDLGRVAIGLGLMLMSLHQLVSLMTPYEDMPSLRLILITVCACHRDPESQCLDLAPVTRAQRPVESRSIKRLTVWLCHFPCTPPRPAVLMRRLFSSWAIWVIDMSSAANCSMMGRSDAANVIASSFALRLCAFSPPSFTPRAFALARPSLVRMEIIRRSFSAKAA